MRRYSKDELKELAVPVFEQEGVAELHATSDGQFFVKDKFAQGHARKHGLGVYALSASDEEKPEVVEETAKLSLEQLAVLIVALGDLTALNFILAQHGVGIFYIDELQELCEGVVNGTPLTDLNFIKAALQGVNKSEVVSLEGTNVAPSEVKPESVKELTARISSIDDPETLKAILSAEAEGLNRSTAIKAINERIDSLTK